ncbi:MAG: gluconate 2-dehydrogenase subunit 3 family protein [Saprospiraceae bacterium]|nr:gluconate 2-dehydrogenase subunit 3 family protein [Saprospiraceae bacterium]
MTRREVIKQTALFTGYALTSSMIQGILTGCQPTSTATKWTPEYFTQNQADFVSALADCILPRTSTPGALDVGVPAYIDMMVKEILEDRERRAFMLGLKETEASAFNEFGNSFMDLQRQQQEELLIKVESGEILAEIERREKRPEEWNFPFFLRFKQMTLAGYFTAKTVGMEVTNYDPVPGAYKGCIPLSDVPKGRIWSSI